MPRNRKPIGQQIAEGDPRKRGANKLQELHSLEVQATKGLPACPARLSGVAAEAWELFTSELEAMGQDAKPDAPALEGACRMFARAVQIDELIDTLKVTKRGMTALRRLHTSSKEAWECYLKFASQFGLSPVSRTRLTIEKKDDEEGKLRETLSRPRGADPAIQ